MYTVTVFKDGEAIAQRNFAIGTFKEIGFWLDYDGYIESQYEIRIIIATT